MTELIASTNTRKRIDGFLGNPKHVLLLCGATGSGKGVLAEEIISKLLPSDTYVTRVKPEKTSISIDQVRGLQADLVRSVPGKGDLRRGVIIRDAHYLTAEAQNALLKTLEEVPENTLIVMTADSSHSLLPTVVSRVHKLEVSPLSKDEVLKHFGDSKEVVQAHHISGGRAEIIQSLLGDSEHSMIEAVSTAKELLQKTTYERLLTVNELSKDRAKTEAVIEALQLLARISMTSAASQDNREKTKQWHQIYKQSTKSLNDLQGNAGAKLVLTDLFLNL